MRRHLVGLTTLLIAAPAVAAVTPPAGSAPLVTWSIAAAPAPSRTPGGELQSLSCTSTSFCMSVGDASGASAIEEPLVETWNGTAWTRRTSPNPPDTTGAGLRAVSCTSSTACMALGSLTFDGGERSYAQAWNGKSWTIDDVPLPAGAGSSALTSLSCRSISQCTAVGAANYNTALVETWNGSSWSVVSTPEPAGATWSMFEAVSCASRTACLAVGSSSTGPFADQWNGTTWSLTPPVAAGNGKVLSGLSCPGSRDCIAVGSAGGTTVAAEQWNGTAWTVLTLPQPASGGALRAVSCASTTSCLAVGGEANAASGTPLAESWDGTAWTIEQPALPGSGQVTLAAIACVSSSLCEVAGYWFGPSQRTLTESRNGAAWAVTPGPTILVPRSSSLVAVSCPASSVCVAVGQKAPGEKPLADSWQGTKWVADKTPDPAGATTASFASVSCPSTTSCMAVGAYDTGVQPTTLTYAFAERWNGSVWSIERVPSVAGEMTALSGVSCVSVSDCVAVGSEAPDGLGGETQPLAASWNGKAWSLETIPMPAGSSAASLAGVSCSSAEVCTAVGYVISAGGRQAALVETLASGTWAPQLAPLPTGANLSWLDGVSCPSATACTAVGAWAVSTIDVQALAEEWNGTAWTVEPVPQAYPSDQSELYGIACSAATACVAVGRALPFPTPPDGLTIGDAWDGSAWSVSPTLDTARAVGDDLHGVACAAGGTCTAVGRVINSDGIVSLIEQS